MPGIVTALVDADELQVRVVEVDGEQIHLLEGDRRHEALEIAQGGQLRELGAYR